MELSKIIEMLGFQYNPARANRREKHYTDLDIIYSDTGIEVLEARSGSIKIRATYNEAMSADSLVDVGFEILSRTKAVGNNRVECTFTTPDCCYLEIQYLRDVRY